MNTPYTIAELAVLLRAVETVNAAMRRRAKLLGQGPEISDAERDELAKIDEIIGDKHRGRSEVDIEAWDIVHRFARTLRPPTLDHPPASIDAALTIADVALRFGQTYRATLHPDGTPESDATHTVMLGLLALECAPPDLDRAKLLGFITVHDLVEYKHGDTNTAWGLTEHERRRKEARETEAVDELRAIGLARIVALIEEYERQDTPEARWVRYVDKVLPKLTHLLNRGQALRKIGMTRADMIRKHAEQGAELAARYPEQEHARALFEAACERCEAELLTEAEQDREVMRRLPDGLSRFGDAGFHFNDVDFGQESSGYLTVRISLSRAEVDKLERERAEISRGYTVVGPGPTPEQEREAIAAMREFEDGRRVPLSALVWASPESDSNGPRYHATVLDAAGDILDGEDLDELFEWCRQHPPGPGLWRWSGYGYVTEGDDGEVVIAGEFLRLTGLEVAAAIHGQPLPEREPETHDEQAELEDLRAQLCVVLGGLPDTSGFAAALRGRATFLRRLHGRDVGSEPERLDGLAAEVEAVGDRYGYSEGSR